MKKSPSVAYVSLIFLAGALSCFAQSEPKLKKSRQAIPNSYIVLLQDGNSSIEGPLPAYRADRVRAEADDLSTFYGGRLKRLYSSSVDGFSVELSPGQAEKLSHDKRVRLVQEDFVI